MGSFILRQKAMDDLLSIGRYTRKEWGKAQQIRYLTQLDRAFHDLADKPGLGRACDEIREGYFKYGVGKHVIFYRHTGKGQIEIVRILHGRMDIEQHL
ncbi:type II toxin-antitoxin system RelE/ParE family toxin [Nitrosomonas europaea]|uniref:type II toxin-antitoxin system RelE/ParE family toxin n=1 Tax=Nitrosomonas europaea TaxID=915 RepID=UPI00326561B0